MEEIGKYVWLQEEEEHGWVPVKISEIKDDCYKLTAVINDEIIEFEVDRADFKIMDVHPSCIEGVDDLLMLGDFNEPTLLQNTRARYYKDRIYSFIGSPILIAVNPYKRLFTNEKLLIKEFKDYFKKIKLEGTNNISPPNPHLYYIGEASYQDMITDKKNQSIIISGESGSGKTESTKIILKYLATVSSELGDEEVPNKAGDTESVEKQVLDSNPLLEAFGNAKTVKNNNSSRFGKFIQVNFTEFGKIISAKIFNYLLEKSRIVKIQAEERNYHIFYQFLYGANEQERSKYCIKEPTYFKYLKHGCFKIEDEDDVKNFIETKECMTKLKFSEDEKKLIFAVLSGILYLGNVEYEEIENNGKIVVKLMEESKADFKLAAEFLGLDVDQLNKILTVKKYIDPLTKKVLERSVSIDAAHNSRDAISKAIYAKMFDWIIKKINSAIANSEKEKLIKDKEKLLKIGILDIFGFEIFEVNSFEQLCINYANERLQQFFNNSIFKLEQDEYIKEKIDWSKIQFKDNKDIIELIDNQSKSIFSLLDSEAMLKNTDDKKFRDNVYQHLNGNPHLISYKGGYGDTIVIQHYAGHVEYLVYEFIEKNNDQLNNDISDAFENSKNKLIKHLFKKKEEASSKNKKSTTKEKDGPNKIQTDSLSKQFKKQLDELLKMLGQSNPRYVKCIKPNSLKKPRIFESLDVNRQLLSAGVLESIKIRKQGYSVRRSKEEFVRRYIPLTPSINIRDYPQSQTRYDTIAADMFKSLANHPEFKDTFDINKKIIQIGLSKIFMKDEVKSFLEFKLNQAVMKYIVVIQAFSRKIVGMKRMKKKRVMTKRLQKNIRGYLLRHWWKKMKSIFKFQMIARNFYSKLVCYHMLNYSKEVHHLKLEEKRKREEEALKRLEEENKKRIEEQKKFQAEMKQQLEIDGHDSNIKPPIKDSFGDISTSDIALINALQGVKKPVKEKKPKKTHLLKDLMTENANPVLEDILKKQIESLEAELNQIKNEKEKLASELDQTKEVNLKKDKEIENLKNKLNNSSSNINSQFDTLNENVDKINNDFQSDLDKKKQQLLNKSDNNNNLSLELKNYEEEVRKLKKEVNEKESTLDILNLKINELTKNNKSLNDLNENLKYQINKGNERLNTEMKHYYDHMQEIELQKTELERKVRELETKQQSNSTLPMINLSLDKSVNKDKDDSLSKSQISDLKKENKVLTKKLEDYKSKFDKEINNLKNSITQKDNKIKEYETKQKSLEDELKSKSDQYETINSEYDICKEKINEMKLKIESLNSHTLKLKEYESEVIKVKNELENSNRKKDNDIKELKDTLDKYVNMNERLKKIEIVLKEELNNKESELSKRQELIKYYQDEYDKISDENMRIKKENLTYKGRLEILEVDYKNKYEAEIKMKSSEIMGLKEKSRTYEKLVNELKEILKKKQRIIDFKKQINLMLVELLKLKRTEVQYLEAHKYTNSSNLKENIAKIKENEQELLNKMNEMTNNPDYTDSEAEEEEENEEDSFESSNDFQN